MFTDDHHQCMGSILLCPGKNLTFDTGTCKQQVIQTRENIQKTEKKVKCKKTSEDVQHDGTFCKNQADSADYSDYSIKTWPYFNSTIKKIYYFSIFKESSAQIFGKCQ